MKKLEEQNPNPADDNCVIPIRKIVLYKHGVGHFERTGSVSGNQEIHLHFKAAEMNDVLKSLTALDLDNGVITSISYESTKPIEKQLKDISLHLSDENSLTGLLAQAKGARVVLSIGSKQVEGTVIGIETSLRKDGDITLTSHRLALLVNGNSLQSYDLLDVSSTTFLDEHLRKDLQHLLDTLISSKKKDQKKLTIIAQGKGKREILASYVVETPIWKTSYRILLDKDKPLIQGWAMVDNTQDEDWESVMLTLVAGLPVSFVHDLYTPRYKNRPVVHVQEDEAYAPPILEQAEEDFEISSKFDMQPAMSMCAAPKEEYRKSVLKRAPASAPDSARMEQARKSAMPVQTRTAEVGDLFQYQITNPVTVRRGQSALVPILQMPFEGKRVAIYNAAIREKNPMSAVLFKNTTGMTLEGGPLTVLEDENYVGESMLDTMKPDEERIIPYSVELGCVISIDPSSKHTPFHLCRIVHGTLHLYRYLIGTQTYVIHNKGDKKLDLFLEHRFNHGWELVETQQPVARTESYYRFRFEVPPKKTSKFTVSEKGEASESYGIDNVDQDTVRAWIESKYINPKIAGELHQLEALNITINGLQSRIDTLEQEIANIFEDQERLRHNLQSLGHSDDERDLRVRYVAEMTQEENTLRSNRDEIYKLTQEKELVENKLREQISSLQFEHKL